MPVPVYVDEDELRRLHGQGLIDREIAERMGLAHRTLARRRQKMGLAHNFDSKRNSETASLGGKPRAKIDEATLRSLHAQGLSSNVISERMGIAENTTRKHLRRLGLENNYRNRPTQADTLDEATLRSLHAQGLSNKQISEQMRVHHDAIGEALRRYGLESNYARSISPKPKPKPKLKPKTKPAPKLVSKPKLIPKPKPTPKPKPNRSATIKGRGQTDAQALYAMRIGIIQAAWRRVVANATEAIR